jgi:glucose-1-phosphate thymidylyltransferase
MNRKGIILAGGAGTRLNPATLATSKQLLPVYDKPMVYYPLSVLMLAGIRDILVVSTPADLPAFKRLFGSGAQWGVRFDYKVQEAPRGLPDAFLVGEEFIDGAPVCLVLGDNIIYGGGLRRQLRDAAGQEEGATIFAYSVRDPERYGVVEFDSDRHVISIEEKPEHPKSRYAVIGLYFYESGVVEMAKSLRPSVRGELEITDLNRLYLEAHRLRVELLGRGVAWLDAGTSRSLFEASGYVAAIQDRQGLMVSCPEEIAFHNGWIGEQDVREAAERLGSTPYATYINGLVVGSGGHG